MRRFLLLAGLVLGCATTAGAEEPPQALQRMLDHLAPGAEPDQIRETPVPGLYEVTFGAKVLYFSEDGRYLVRGEMIDLQAGRNLTAHKRNTARATTIGRFGDERMIVYTPKAEVAHTVTVFTDIECPHCRRLHQQIDDYLERGIRVRYVFYPPSGPGTVSFRKAVSVWCADDRRQALTAAKNGEAVPERECDNPVRAQYELGRSIGVSGTPYIVAEDGRAIPGYVPAARLQRILDSGADVAVGARNAR